MFAENIIWLKATYSEKEHDRTGNLQKKSFALSDHLAGMVVWQKGSFSWNRRTAVSDIYWTGHMTKNDDPFSQTANKHHPGQMSFSSKWAFRLNDAFHFFPYRRMSISAKRRFVSNGIFGQIIFSAIWHFWPHVHFGQNDIFGQPTFVQRGFVLIVCSTKWHIRPNNIRSNGFSMSKILILTRNKTNIPWSFNKIFWRSSSGNFTEILLVLRDFSGTLCGAHIYRWDIPHRHDGWIRNGSINIGRIPDAW